ncbi:MAG TPA: hypothetical protein VMN04_01615 [Thermoanaerobaculia bacterium]|nr:hypothetical protein [Thermoanaerobaculia bacterium]
MDLQPPEQVLDVIPHRRVRKREAGRDVDRPVAGREEHEDLELAARESHGRFGRPRMRLGPLRDRGSDPRGGGRQPETIPGFEQVDERRVGLARREHDRPRDETNRRAVAVADLHEEGLGNLAPARPQRDAAVPEAAAVSEDVPAGERVEAPLPEDVGGRPSQEGGHGVVPVDDAVAAVDAAGGDGGVRDESERILLEPGHAGSHGNPHAGGRGFPPRATST